MEKFKISESPEFTEELRKLQVTDEAHADVFNALFEKLLNNDVYLNRLADVMLKKESIIHDTTDADSDKIPGADVTAKLQEQINSNQKNCNILIGGIEILSNSDLNDYKTPGNYYCQHNGATVTILNRPANMDYAFTLKVDYGTGTAYPCQTLRMHTDGSTYYRYCNSTWREWHKLTV